MFALGPYRNRRSWIASWILLVWAVQWSHLAAAEPQSAGPGAQSIRRESGDVPILNLRFTHLTTNDGLSQGYVADILQDRRGFMWFATRDGLNRYDGYDFVVYKHDPNDPGSLNSNFLQDLLEDDEGYLWVATNTGVSRFDPATERCIRYLHDPNDPATLGGASVKSIARDPAGGLLRVASPTGRGSD
jgi:ligand-binding sensor domain-containing protein